MMIFAHGWSIMFFSQTFLKSSFSVQAFGQFLLIMFLLSSVLCFLVNSYSVDNSCLDYKGRDIRPDIRQAVIEVDEMARNAVNVNYIADRKVVDLFTALFGGDIAQHWTVRNIFQLFANFVDVQDYTIVCGDQMVYLAPNKDGPHGMWVDLNHQWTMNYDDFNPCEPTRKPDGATELFSYTINQRFIYLCPAALDNPNGRFLAPYKDRIFTAQPIDDYYLVPTVLLCGLLHLPFADRKFPPR